MSESRVTAFSSSARSGGFSPAQVYGLTVLGFFILRSRIHPRGLVCNQAMFDDCKQFLREPGSNSEESQWFKDGWCVTSSTEEGETDDRP